MRIISGSRKALRVGIINKFLKVDNYYYLKTILDYLIYKIKNYEKNKIN